MSVKKLDAAAILVLIIILASCHGRRQNTLKLKTEVNRQKGDQAGYLYDRNSYKLSKNRDAIDDKVSLDDSEVYHTYDLNPGVLYGRAAIDPRSVQADYQPMVDAGVLTATEINDFAKWDLWEDIADGFLGIYAKDWTMRPQDRITVLVSNNNKPVHNATVKLYNDEDEVVWEAMSDNNGRAELWVHFFIEFDRTSYVIVEKNGVKEKLENIKRFNDGVNHANLAVDCEISNEVDLLFVVDATASMGDEINHLKSELADIVQQVIANNPKLEMNLGSMFYKCQGNSYTTLRSDFTTDVDSIVNFIRQQNASEGGDEAVEIALHEAINEYQWNHKANSRMLVLVLDEAPNDTTDAFLKLNILDAARKGIKIIPVVASGVNGNKDKSLEYLVRCMALATGGTNAFLTDDSGVGNAHTAPTTDTSEVELLNQLLIRVISAYSFIAECDDTNYLAQKNVKDTTEIEMKEYVLDRIDTLSVDSVKRVYLEDTIYLARVRDTAIFNLVVNDKINFFPNPVSSQLNYSSSFEVDYLYLFDSHGRILQRKQVNARNASIDVTPYCNGYYYVGCLYENKWRKSKIVIKH